MYGDVITFFVDLCDILHMFYATGKIPCSIYGNVRIITKYFHSKMCCGICYLDTDRTKSDHAEFLTGKLGSREVLFLLLSKLCDIRVSFLGKYPFHTAPDVTGCKKHSRNHKFFYAICICARCIEYNDSLFCAFVKRNIVDSGSGSCHCS